MTRAEAEARVREIPKTCKGLELVDRAIQLQFMERIYVCTVEALPQLVRDVIELRMTLGFPETKIFPDTPGWLGTDFTGTIEKFASNVDLLAWCLQSIRSHQSDVGNPCGRDFNDEICANPFDGEVRNYACPACGLTGTYRSPFYEIQ